MKDTVERMKRQVTDWGKTGHRKLCPKDIVGKEPCPKYTFLLKFNKKTMKLKEKNV